MTRIEQALLVVTGVLMTLAGAGWCASAPRVEAVQRLSAVGVIDVRVTPADSIDTSARKVAETDPFRLERRPASIAYRPDLEGVAPPPKPPKPQLVLEGLVGGAALLDGVPGRTATMIVHVDDTLGGLRIRRVGRDTVVVSGADTTWRLTLRRVWQ